MTKSYTFHASLWLYKGDAAWHFLTLPEDSAAEIKDYFAHVTRGWGSLPVLVTIGSTEWQTSIFPDKQTGSFLLPIKAAVRKAEQLQAGAKVQCTISLHD